jgi:hypothetical protein
MALFSQDISWTSMSTFQRLRWIIMGLVAGGKFIEGFIDQGVGKLKAEISNSAASDTSLWQRAVSAVPEARQFQSPSLPLGGTQQFARQPELPPTPPATTVTAAVTVKSQQ